MRHLRRTALLLPFVLLLSSAPAGASFLRALVAEVPDGATLVVVSSNRRLTVVLKGVGAPRDAHEAEQARRHLAALALGREVTVEYTGLRGQSIHGRVLCGGMDLGLQVVRDGAARYDSAADNALTADERRLYADSESAARSERRGVWQPRETPSLKGAAQLALSSEVSVAPASQRAARSSLSTEDLLARRIAASREGTTKPVGRGQKETRWPLNKPGQNFDFSRHLGRGRTTLVYFYADWCPACRKLSPSMRQINLIEEDLEVLALNIEYWGSPVASAHGVNYVPYFQVYDETGVLIAEGESAGRWLVQEADRRMKR